MFAGIILHTERSIASSSDWRLPFNGSHKISQGCPGGNPAIGTHVDSARDALDFVMWEGTRIYSPADGVIVHAGWYGDYGKLIVIKDDNDYFHYLAHLSMLKKSEDEEVKKGDFVGLSGNTGNSQGNTGYHLHYHIQRGPWETNDVSLAVSDIRNIPGVNMYPDPDCANDPYDGEATYVSDPWFCDGVIHDIVIYEHANYEGQCVGFSGWDLAQTYNVPSGFGLSSIYVNPIWQLTHNLRYWDNHHLTGSSTMIWSSIPDISHLTHPWYGLGGWNDQDGSLHNSYTGWLSELSLADSPPLGTDIHVVVEDPGHHDALRICFNGVNCQETGATELNYHWPTYLEEEGSYTITVERRLLSHNQNWDNADKQEFAYYITKHHEYTACGLVTEGATLTTGSQCVGVLVDVADLMPVHWENRSDLQVCAIGDVGVWAYDGVRDNWGNFNGIPKVVDSGQCKNVGDNVSSIDIQESGGIVGSVPNSPFATDSDTIVHYRFDNDATDEVGNYNGTTAGSASYVTGKFGSALNAPNPPDGSGVVASAFDLNAFTLDLWLARPAGSTGGRVACQLGGGSNTGQNKWCLHLNGNRPELEIWSNGGSQKLQPPYDLPDDSSWHYINVSYDGIGSAVMYVDNVYAGTLTTAGEMNTGAITFEVGMGEGIYSCNCHIDELRIRSGVHPPEVGSEIPPTSTPTPTSTSEPTPTPAPNVVTTTFDSLDDASCGGVRSIGNSWPHSQSDVRDTDGCQNVNYISSYLNAGSYFVKRGYTSFDTSSIPDGAEVISAIVKLYIHNGNFDNANSTSLELVKATQGTTLGLEDFSNIGNTSFASLPLSSIQRGNVNDFTLSGDLESLINKTGTTQIGLRLGLDLNNQTPTGINQLKAWLEPGANGMKLLVSYTEPQQTPTPIPTITPTPIPPTPTPSVTPTPLPPDDFIIINSTLLGYEAIYKAESDGSSWLKLAGEGSGSWKHAGYPRVSPDGQWVAYEAHNGARYLWIVGIDGNSKQQLYSNPIKHARIVWAPDSSKIMFVGDNNIPRTIEPDGSDLTVISGWPTNYKPTSWCSNGRILAHYYDGNDNDLYALNPDGSNVVQLTTDSAHDSRADWSPNCNQIVFESNRSGRYEIWVMNADGTNQTQVTTTPNNEWSIYPVWSPDGSKILFSSSRDSSGYWELFTMNADGSNVTNVTNTGNNAAEQWSDWGQ